MKEYSLITGAAGLLGEQHAIALANVGFSLILTDIDKKKLSLLKNKLKKKFKNIDIIVHPMDITREKEIISMKSSLLKQKLKITVLVNNAALNPKMKNKIIKKKNGGNRELFN